MRFYILLAFMSLFDVLAVIAARFYVEKKEIWIMWTCLLSFMTSAYFYVQVMEYRLTAIVNVLAAALSTIVATFVFYLVFKERVTRGQWVGIAIAFIGILMLEM